eukprot:TRINITY_DN15046_c0_g1_i3.p1 TRINITY_DN15046_c0_g1~~TRINITY_DN15046_c0_g1_i3.p1  ORF type:complete len:110 (-),score=21.45 TRINITY_DN15046_c0_g1_i3:27-356(-)
MQATAAPVLPISLSGSMQRSHSAPELAVLARARRLAALSERRQAHNNGTCSPCGFFTQKVDGCRLGDDCRLCHLCTAEDVKAKRRLKRSNATASRRQQAAQAAWHGRRQ